MIRSIRELLDLHTRFDTGDGFFTQYARSVHDKITPHGVLPDEGLIRISETHKKLLSLAHEQNILHKDIGYIRALRLTDGVYYYDVGLQSIDGNIFSRGTSLDLDEAVARAFGELYERVSMRFVPPGEEVVRASVRELTGRGIAALALADLPRATSDQKKAFPEMNWDDGSIFAWVWAHNLYTNEPTLVPAQLAHWGYRRPKEEPLLGQISTHGLGAGYTQEGAAGSAAAEVVQRHSFFTYWYARIAPPCVEVDSIVETSGGVEPYTKTLINAVRAYGFEVHLLDCTLPHGAPSVAVVLTKSGLGWFVGMSTGTSYETVIQRATCEALSTYVWTMNSVDRTSESVFQQIGFASGFCDPDITDWVRVHRWAQEHAAKEGRFFLEGKARSFTEVRKRHTSTPIQALQHFSKGEALVRFATQPYLNETDFHVASIVAPHLYKLALYESVSTPVLHGKEPKNLYPHPFP